MEVAAASSASIQLQVTLDEGFLVESIFKFVSNTDVDAARRDGNLYGRCIQ